MRQMTAKIKRLEDRLSKQSSKLDMAEEERDSLRQRLEGLLKAKLDLEGRLGSAKKEAAKLREGGQEGLGDLEAARAQVFELEETNAALKRVAEVEMPAKIRKLEIEVVDAQASVGRAAQTQVSTERRRDGEAKEDGDSGGGGGRLRSVRSSDDAFLRVEDLEEQLAAVQRERKQLQLQVLGQDSAALEQRFDLNLKEQEVERLRRRIRELEAANVLRGGGGGGGGGGGFGDDNGVDEGANPIARRAGKRFSRERDLEGVVDGLQRVIHKVKAENERLRAGAAGQVKLAAAQRAAKDAREKASRLEQEVMSLRNRMSAGEDAMHRLAQRQEQVNQLKRTLRTRDEELKLAQRAANTAEGSLVNAELATQQAAERNRALEEEVSRLRAGRQGAAESDTAALGAARQEIERLRGDLERSLAKVAVMERDGYGTAVADGEVARVELDAARREVRRLQGRLARSSQAVASGQSAGDEGKRGTSGAGKDAGTTYVERLREENSKLREELSAFDLDFFEEIEDLKFKYAEAMQRLQQYA